MKYYYTPQLGADLSQGFDTFEKLDDSRDGHLDSLLRTIIGHEEKEGKKIDANVVTWRGMMTKVSGRQCQAALLADPGLDHGYTLREHGWVRDECDTLSSMKGNQTLEEQNH